MTQKEQIRQEIERRRDFFYERYMQKGIGCIEEIRYDECVEILSFIDSLPDGTVKTNGQGRVKDNVYNSLTEEKPSEDLEVAAKEYARLDEEGKWKDGGKYKGFIAGAEWMRKKDVEDMYMSDNRHFIKCYEQGKVDMKVEMIKEVNYGVVCKNGERDEEDVWIELNPGSLPDYKDTDPIDFIIVKEDE